MPVPAGTSPALGPYSAWVPTARQVAAHVPWLTVSATAPGSQAFLGDFTDDTVPDAAAAQIHIDSAAVTIGAVFATLPAQPVGIRQLATEATALYAAASLAIAYARSDSDRQRAEGLLARSRATFTSLQSVADNAGADTTATAPVLIAPDPVAHGDWLL